MVHIVEWAVVNSLTVLVLAPVVWGVGRLCPWPSVRHTLWLVLLLKLLTPPLVTVPVESLATDLFRPVSSVELSSSATNPADAALPLPLPVNPSNAAEPLMRPVEPDSIVALTPASQTESIALDASAVATTPSVIESAAAPFFSREVAQAVLQGFLVVWLIGTTVFFAVQMFRLVRFARRLGRFSLPCERLERETAAIAARLGLAALSAGPAGGWRRLADVVGRRPHVARTVSRGAVRAIERRRPRHAADARIGTLSPRRPLGAQCWNSRPQRSSGGIRSSGGAVRDRIGGRRLLRQLGDAALDVVAQVLCDGALGHHRLSVRTSSPRTARGERAGQPHRTARAIGADHDRHRAGDVVTCRARGGLVAGGFPAVAAGGAGEDRVVVPRTDAAASHAMRDRPSPMSTFRARFSPQRAAAPKCCRLRYRCRRRSVCLHLRCREMRRNGRGRSHRTGGSTLWRGRRAASNCTTCGSPARSI